MKKDQVNRIVWLTILYIFSAYSFAVAQGAGDPGEDPDLSDDNPGVPLDDGLPLLLLAGIAYLVWTFWFHKKRKSVIKQ